MDIIKNNCYEIKIEDISTNGEGIGKIDGYAVFVKDAVIGDYIRTKIIKTKKNYGYGRIEEIIEPSPMRIVPPCPIYKQCGGCQIQPLGYEAQLAFKENKVKRLLEKIGGIHTEVSPILGMNDPYFYRNKAQFPVGRDKDGNVVIGFYASRSHNIIGTDKCYIQHPINETIVSIVKRFIEEYNLTTYDESSHTGLVRHLLTRVGFRSGQVMVCLVINGKKLPMAHKLVEMLQVIEGIKSICYSINEDKTNVIMGKQIKQLWGSDTIEDTIGEVTFKISPLSFYQVNPSQTEVLYNKALEYAGLTGEETVWDLYCGIGTISLFLAKQAKKVYGVELVDAAIEDARENASMNHIENVEFFVGKAEEVLPQQYKEHGVYADIIVVDPPRKGCEEVLLDTMVQMEPKRIVYVSCDPATLARDLKYLVEKGYRVEKVQPVDMFGGTVHVETVVLMSRVED